MSLEAWKTLVGTSATISLIIQFLVGIQVCNQFFGNKTTGDTSGMTFLVGVVMTYSWYSYGVLIHDFSIQFVNVIGLFLQAVYSFCFLAFTPLKWETGQRMTLVGIFMMTVQVYMMFEEDEPTEKLRVGILSSSMAVAYCSAPLASIQHVCQTRSTGSLPFYLILATAAVTAQWSLYGIIIQDTFLLVPNMIGCAVACFQLGLFCYFPSREAEQHYSVVGVDT